MSVTDALWRRWLRLWAWGFAAYTVIGILAATQYAANAGRAGQAVDWTGLLTSRVLGNWGYALFIPPLFLLVRRWPLDRASWFKSAPVLLAATFVCVMIKCVGVEPLLMRMVPAAGDLGGHVFGEMYDMSGIVIVAQAISFSRRAHERERQAAQLREQLTQAQLDALRSQLNPHFLFNALNGAASLMHSDVAGADRMLTELSDLLRATLAYSGAQEIALAEELALLDRYVAIMRVRFRDRLTVRVDAGAEARRGLVPAFLLQPLVENALQHGIGARPGPGRVEVYATRVDGHLTIRIRDDGPGPGAAPRTGVGLANTRARLAQLYGAAQSLTLTPAPGGSGAEVTVSLPWRPAAPAA